MKRFFKKAKQVILFEFISYTVFSQKVFVNSTRYLQKFLQIYIYI